MTCKPRCASRPACARSATPTLRAFLALGCSCAAALCGGIARAEPPAGAGPAVRPGGSLVDASVQEVLPCASWVFAGEEGQIRAVHSWSGKDELRLEWVAMARMPDKKKKVDRWSGYPAVRASVAVLDASRNPDLSVEDIACGWDGEQLALSAVLSTAETRSNLVARIFDEPGKYSIVPGQKSRPGKPKKKKPARQPKSAPRKPQ